MYKEHIEELLKKSHIWMHIAQGRDFIFSITTAGYLHTRVDGKTVKHTWVENGTK